MSLLSLKLAKNNLTFEQQYPTLGYEVVWRNPQPWRESVLQLVYSVGCVGMAWKVQDFLIAVA